MSVDVFPDVLYLEMKAGRKLVMAVLADHANEIGECWPSQALLGFRASISVPKLRDHLKELEKDDWLRTYIGAGPRGVNVYALNLSKISQASANERHRIKEEKGSHRRDITDCQVGTPDFSDTPPDSEDLPPDFRPSSPDSQDTPPGLRSPTEPSRNRQEPSIEPQKESTADFPQIQEILYTPEGSIATEKQATEAKEWVRDWAELEHDSPDLSEPQRVSLKKVLFRVCADIPKTDLLTELWSWDFLESEEKDEWKKRIEDQYSALRSSVK